MSSYEKLLNIPLEGTKLPLFDCISNTPIATQYQRVVIGQRGPYVEFTKNQICDHELYIPKSQLYRLSDPKVYYIEFRTLQNNVKVYYQMRSVAYADYLINHFYISPTDLFFMDNDTHSRCIKEKTNVSIIPEEFFETV
jgi:hypothetical protein